MSTGFNIFGAALTGTQYSNVIYLPPGSADVGLTFSHPGPGTTTTYGLEVSNSDRQAEVAGTARWAPYAAKDSAGVALGEKSAADVFTVKVSPPYSMMRVKMTTTLGSGVGAIDANVKQRSR